MTNHASRRAARHRADQATPDAGAARGIRGRAAASTRAAGTSGGHRRPASERVALRLRRSAPREAVAVVALVASFAIAPPATAAVHGYARADDSPAYVAPTDVNVQVVTRDLVDATPGAETLAEVGTNEAWARLVLLDGGWAQTDDNVTVMLRWMRQENGTDNWWNRNNPMNNSLGNVGAGGTGTYPNLIVAAHYAAANLQRPIFADIAGALAANQSADATAVVIWASRWSTSHYANGAHWSTRPVDEVKAPASAWGL